MGRWLVLTFAVVIGTLGLVIFMVPAHVSPTGISGLGVILNHLFGVPIGAVILVGNIPIQILAYRFLGGWKVMAATLYVLVLYSILVEVMRLPPAIAALSHLGLASGASQNTLLNAVFGGICGGISSGLVFRAGATFGGTSTLARIIQLRRGTPMAMSGLYTDAAVIALAAFAYHSWEAAMYSLVALFLGGIAVDYVLEGPSVVRTGLIITDRPREVTEAILYELGRGVTAWSGVGMYTAQPRSVLFVTMARPQVAALRDLVARTDPHAFLVIGQGHTAHGEGFQLP